MLPSIKYIVSRCKSEQTWWKRSASLITVISWDAVTFYYIELPLVSINPSILISKLNLSARAFAQNIYIRDNVTSRYRLGKNSKKYARIHGGEHCALYWILREALNRGYKFFVESYLHDVWTAERNPTFYVKAKCFASQKKNDEPH